MNSTWGNKVKYSLFGESHGDGVGITMHGLPSGIYIDMHKINKNLMRRMTGTSLCSKRKENDQIMILSGEKNNYTSGSPLTFYIKNKDVISKDYEKLYNNPRPSHADYAHLYKYGNYADLRGSGHLSARLTAPIVAAGSLISSIDKLKNIYLSSQIYQVANIKDGDEYDYSILENLSQEESEKIKDYEISMIDQNLRNSAEKLILKAIKNKDSLGSKLRFSVKGLQAGIGEPFFDSLESKLAHLLFSVPAVKAVEFGIGRNFASSNGSSANDSFRIKHNKVVTTTNNSGGINGGITNGMPVNFSVSFRPSPTIGQTQDTVDLNSMSETKLTMQGRHDACVGLRALPIIEAISYMAIYDLM